MKSNRVTIWANVMNHSGYYISMDGDVCSAKSNYDGRVLKKWKRLQLRVSEGYVSRVSLSDIKGVHRFSPHQLVGMHFPVGGIGKHINHKNGIKNDNRVENLEWSTPKENEQHAWKILGKTHSREANLDRSKALRSVIPVNRINVQYTKEQVERVIQLNKAGVSLHVIAFKVGISHSAPGRIVKAKEIGIYTKGTKRIEYVVIQ